MSETDSFIEEVTEEVRQDRVFNLLRRYGWIGVVAVLAIVGGTAFNEWSKAQARAKAQAAGDAIVAALETNAPEARVAALDALDESKFTPGASAIVDFLKAAELGSSGEDAAAQAALGDIAAKGDLPDIYRQIATFKEASLTGDLSVDDRRQRLSTLTRPGQPLRLLATEQLALIDIETGDKDAALEKLQALVVDAEVTAGLRQRATQLIIAMGAEPQRIAGQEAGAAQSSQ